MKTLKIILLSMLFSMVSCVITNAASDGSTDANSGKTPKEILGDKMAVANGGCYFKEGKFLMFAEGKYMSPKGTLDRRICIVFVEDAKMDPTWLFIFDNKGQPREIIEWKDPGQFRTLWKHVEGVGI